VVERETRVKVEIVRADNGTGEFGQIVQDHLSDEGMKLEASPSYKHSMNGVIEKAMQEIFKLIRSMIDEASENLWCLAAEHAVYLRNREPTSALPWGLPWEPNDCQSEILPVHVPQSTSVLSNTGTY
jgi:hypothetical protein